MHACMHTYIHTYKHTYIHTYIYICIIIYIHPRTTLLHIERQRFFGFQLDKQEASGSNEQWPQVLGVRDIEPHKGKLGHKQESCEML